MMRRPKRGFSLPEFLLAIGILAMAAVPVIFLFRSSVQASRRGATDLQALFLAQYVMEKIKHDLVEDPELYHSLEEYMEIRTPLVESPPESLTVTGARINGYSSTAVAVINPGYVLAGGGVPAVPSRYFKEFEDRDRDGVLEGAGIKKEEYPELYRSLSRYLLSVVIEDGELSNCPVPLKKVIVNVHWTDEKRQPRTLSLFSWEGPYVSSF